MNLIPTYIHGESNNMRRILAPPSSNTHALQRSIPDQCWLQINSEQELAILTTHIVLRGHNNVHNKLFTYTTYIHTYIVVTV